MSTRSLLVRGALWISLTRILVNMIGFASTIILARLLVPEDFGLVAIAGSVAAIVGAISELSLSQALIQHDDPQEDHFHTAFTMNALRAVLLALVLAALGWPASVAYGDDRLIALMSAFALANLIGGLVNPRLALFERRLEFHQWVILSGGEKLAGFVVAASIAFAFQSYWALVASVVASQVARVVASYLLMSYRPRLTLLHYKELLSFSIWLTLGQMVQSLNWRADPLLIAAFLPTRAVGHYSMGHRVATLAVGEVLQPISQVLFPAFSRLKNEPERLKEAYLRAQGLLCMIAMPIGFGVAATADPLVALFLGNNWTGAGPVIQFLAVAAAIQRAQQLQPIAMATGSTKMLFYRDLRALFIRVPLTIGGLIFGPELGVGALPGALIGHTISSVINTLLNMHLASKISLVTVREQCMGVWRPIIAAVAMAAAVLAGLDFAATLGSPNIVIALALGISMGVVVYPIAIIILWLLAGRPRGAESDALALILQQYASLRSR